MGQPGIIIFFLLERNVVILALNFPSISGNYLENTFWLLFFLYRNNFAIFQDLDSLGFIYLS